jgi:hypothetical protein
MRSNRFFNCTSLRTRRRIFPIAGIEEHLASFRECSAGRNRTNVHRAGSDGGPGHGTSVAARVVGEAIGTAIGNLCRSVSGGMGLIGVSFSFAWHVPGAPCGHGPDEAGPSRDGAGPFLDWHQGRARAPSDKTNSDLSDACANASAVRSNRFFNCTSMRAATDAPYVGHPSLRTRRRIFPISGSELLLASFRECSAGRNGTNVHRAGSDGGPGHGTSVAARVAGEAIGTAIGNLCRSVSGGIGQIGVSFSFAWHVPGAPVGTARTEPGPPGMGGWTFACIPYPAVWGAGGQCNAPRGEPAARVAHGGRFFGE